MSMSFPIIYNAKDNCNITKYYQFASSGIKLEKDICLKNLLQENTIATIQNLDAELYTESGVIVDETNYYQNLSINDPNCCISNPTAFCISSNFIQQPEQDNQSYTITTGESTFFDVPNIISSVIQLESDNSPIFDTDIFITITDGPKIFNSTDNKWTALFANDNNDLLQRAVNSQLNNQNNESLISIGEDIDFNNNYSLGNNQASYYTLNETTNKVEANTIAEDYLPSINDVTITIHQYKITPESIGSYKIYQQEANISLQQDSNNNNNISEHYVIGNNANNINNQLLSNVTTLERYLELINDVTDNNSFRIEVLSKNSGSGLNFNNSNDNNLFTIDNTPMIDNLLFMENIVYNSDQGSLPITLQIIQNDMSVNPSDETNAYLSNLNYFTLSQNGEMLGEDQYNIDGKIVLNVAAKNDRVLKLVESSPNKFHEILVDYVTMPEIMKTTRNVSYEIINIASPTGNGQYNSVADNNGASLYANETLTDFNNMSLVSNLTIQNDEIIIIKVSPLTTLTGGDLSDQNLYILDDRVNDINGNPVYDVPVNAHVNVSITGNITNLRNNDDLRFLFYPKTLTNLNIANLGNGYINPIEVVETTLDGLSSTNNWLIGYSNNTYPYLTSASSVFTKFNIFPSLSTYINICKNDLYLDLNIIYSLDANNLDLPKVTVSHGALSEYNINAASIDITGVSVLQNVNTEIVSTLFELMPNVSIGSPPVSYKQVKKTTVSTYNAMFNFNLAGFNNIKMMTPKIESTIIEYIYYTNNTIIQIDNNGSTLNTGSTQPSRVSSLNFTTHKTIKMQSTNSTRIQTMIELSQQSITPLLGRLQMRNKNGINSYTAWENTGGVIQSIDPYQNLTITPSGSTGIGYSVTVNIFPISTANDVYGEVVLEFFQPYYFTPLILNNAITTGLVTGYKYNINALYSIIASAPPEEYSIGQLNPNYYLDNDLITYGGTPLNLNMEITYTDSDAKEGNSTYGSTMVIKDVSNRDRILATITSTTPSFNSTIVIAKINKSLYSVKKRVGTETTVISLIGDDLTNTLDLQDGVKIDYDNGIEVNDFISFSLNSDKIAVNLNGLDAGTPSFITSLEYSKTGCESLTIPYYRGYASDDTSIQQTLNYTIVRSDLIDGIILVGTNRQYETDVFANLYVNSTNTVSFNNNIGSIGTTFKSLFSRLPAEILSNGSKSMPIVLSSDTIRITRKSTNTITTDVPLINYKLYTFENGEVLKALNLRVSTANDYHELVYSKSQTLVYYNSNYIGDPADLTNENWGTEILSVTFAEAKNGIIINSVGENEDGFLGFSVSDNTRTNSTTFIVIAMPQLFATQLTVDGAVQLPFNTNDNDFYDVRKLITMYFPINYYASVYNPFFNSEFYVNNVTFTGDFSKDLYKYAVSNENFDPSYFTIIGSSIEIKEVSIDRAPTLLNPPQSMIITPTTNGPDDNGIIFSGLISDLLELPEDNIYYDYVRTTVGDNKVIKLSYTQDSNTFFDDVFNDNVVKPTFNIKLSIDGFFIQPGVYSLVSSITKGIQTFIYDMVKRENNVVLLKYECFNIDFTNMPKDTMIRQINFIPTAVYTSVVTLPELVFGENYLSVFNNITAANLTTDQSGNIVWTQLPEESETALKNNFCLNIAAINNEGLNNIIELLFATSEIPRNFTVIKQPNAMEILATDGTPKFIITPFGQILTSSINVKSVTFFDSDTTKSSNIELVETNSGVISGVV